MSKGCITEETIRTKKYGEILRNKFQNMEYGQKVTVYIKLPECGCTDENCFDYGTRRLYEVVKTEFNSESYYSSSEDEKGDEKIPGLDFIEKYQNFDPQDQQWKPFMFDEITIFRVTFSTQNNEVKVEHTFYDSDECISGDEIELIEKFINIL